MQNWIYLGIAALSGAAMALQGSLNAALGKMVGIWESILLVHIIGLLTIVGIFLIMGIGLTNFQKLGEVPWYIFLGGGLNVLIIYAVVRTIPQIGVGNATTAIIVAQILTAILIDSIGAFGLKKHTFQYIDILGVILLAIGARILLVD